MTTNTETEFQKNTREFTKFHLSLTGVYAGMILCGAERGAAGEKSFHAAYAPAASLTDHRMCPECLAIWNTPDDEL